MGHTKVSTTLDLYSHKKMKTNPENSLESLKNALPVLENLGQWTTESVHDALINLATETGVKNGVIMWPVRTALSGKPNTPGGAIELCILLGKEETLVRIKDGITKLS